MNNSYTAPITALADNEVFVFGANPQGFHGAGSAGYASFGVPGNQWRAFGYGNKPHGWKGLWNEKGKTGPMIGTHGKSYGLVTVKRAGAKCSMSIDEIAMEVEKLYECALRNPGWTFYVAQSGTSGLNGWPPEQMAEAFAAFPVPPNVSFDSTFFPFVERACGAP